MLFNAKIENPMLIGAIEVMRADENPEKKEAVLEEILKATFLCPATVSEPPLEGEDGQPYLNPDGIPVLEVNAVVSRVEGASVQYDERIHALRIEV